MNRIYYNVKENILFINAARNAGKKKESIYEP